MKKILIQGGRVIDPASGFDALADVAIVGSAVHAIQHAVDGFAPDVVLDAKDCIVMPGLVDLAVRLREPGQEHAGMLASELAAAVAGGVTSVVRAWMSERATRECNTSPTMATVRLVKSFL